MQAVSIRKEPVINSYHRAIIPPCPFVALTVGTKYYWNMSKAELELELSSAKQKNGDHSEKAMNDPYCYDKTLIENNSSRIEAGQIQSRHLLKIAAELLMDFA